MFKVGDKIRSVDNMYYGEVIETKETFFYSKLFYTKDDTLCLKNYSTHHDSLYWVLASKYPQIKTKFLGGLVL